MYGIHWMEECGDVGHPLDGGVYGCMASIGWAFQRIGWAGRLGTEEGGGAAAVQDSERAHSGALLLLHCRSPEHARTAAYWRRLRGERRWGARCAPPSPPPTRPPPPARSDPRTHGRLQHVKFMKVLPSSNCRSHRATWRLSQLGVGGSFFNRAYERSQHG